MTTPAEQDRTYVWHPFTQMQAWQNSDPLIIDRGEGVRLFDTEGRAYYDANSSLWVNIHGHNHPHINAAITEQLGKVAHSTLLGLSHAPASQLAERLVSVAPAGLTKVFYSDSGSTAVEIAVKMAFQYWQHRGQPQRTRCIALQNGYHGDTLGAVSVGGIGLFHGIFKPLLFEAQFAPSPAQFATAEEAAAAIEAALAEHPGEVFAVIMEPLVQAAGGMLIQPPGLLRLVRDLCDRYDVLLIVDEVATGFGRTGTLFACEQEYVTPDIMTVAKGITGGYLPLAATLTTEAIYETFLGAYADLKTFFHGHSYTANPLACAAALASLEIFERDNVLAALQPKIAQLSQRLERIAAYPHVGSVRQCGFMAGIELVQDKKAGTPYPWSDATGAAVCAFARTLGLITRPLLDVVIVLPPLSTTAEELDDMLDIIETSIESVTGRGGSS